jgi:hypothetical protein
MTIELSKNEIELLDEALDVWEKKPHSEGMISSMLGMMTRRGEETKEQTASIMRKEIDEAIKETQQRRFKAILLRAKLIQALNKESEHDIA